MIVMSPMAPDNQCPEFMRITFVSRASLSYDNHQDAMRMVKKKEGYLEIEGENTEDRTKRLAREWSKTNKEKRKQYKANRKDKIRKENAARYSRIKALNIQNGGVLV